MEGFELYLNEKYIELSEESRIGLTLIANDIGSVQNKRANFSNQFKVPKTGNNLINLGYPNDLNGQSDLPYTKLSCRAVQDGVEIITNGYAIINDSDEFISVTVYSGNADFFEAIKGLKLTDIDLSAYNHVWNLANIVDNIDNQTNEDCYVYGLVAYGESLPSGGSVRVKYLLPSIRAKILLEKIVSNSGFDISGALYDDPNSILHKMILPYSRNEEQQDESVYIQQKFNAGLVAAKSDSAPSGVSFYPYGVNGHILFNDETTPPYFDTSGLQIDGEYTSALQMFQSFSVIMNIDITITAPPTYVYINGGVGITIDVIATSVTGLKKVIKSVGNSYYGLLDGVPFPTTYTLVTDSTLINVGDKITTNVRISNNLVFLDVAFQVINEEGTVASLIKNTSNWLNTIDGNIVYGQTLIMSSLLPDMLQSDYIKTLLQMTCGQIQTNNYSNTIYLSSFQEVTENTTIKDWSERYNDKTDQIKFHSSYSQNNYLKYKSDSSNEVTPGVPNNIGDGVIIINDEALTKEATIIQLQFAGTPTTPTARHIGGGLYKVLPLINKVDPKTFYFTLNTEPRILLYERETYATPVRYLGDTSVDPPPYDFLLSANYTTWFIDTSTYRTFQLGFNNNLIQKFFQTLIGILTKYKEVEVEINLTVADLNNYFDHNIPVYIEKYQEKFYVSSVNNYQNGKLTKCTLIRL